MMDFFTKIKLGFFKLRLNVTGKFGKVIEILKDNFNPRRNSRLNSLLKKLSEFIINRTEAIKENKEKWEERISLGNDFAV